MVTDGDAESAPPAATAETSAARASSTVLRLMTPPWSRTGPGDGDARLFPTRRTSYRAGRTFFVPMTFLERPSLDSPRGDDPPDRRGFDGRGRLGGRRRRCGGRADRRRPREDARRA